jgi:uncharacterized membrane protein YccC
MATTSRSSIITDRQNPAGMLDWLRTHDPRFAALRRAGRAAIVMPSMFAIGDKVIGNPTIATFAAFGSFAMILLVDFPGPIRARLQAQITLAVACGVFISLATLCSNTDVLAALAMAVVGFGILFAGVVSSTLAGATTTLLLSFILPVSLPGPASQIPDRLAGWGLASLASLFAITLLWPAPARDPVRSAAIAACRAMAARLRADVAQMLEGADPAVAREASAKAIQALDTTFFATPYRPTGLSTAARTIVRLVDELKWLHSVVTTGKPTSHVDRNACAVKKAAAALLDRGADLLDAPRSDRVPLHDGQMELDARLGELERGHVELDGNAISALDPGFRAQEIAFVVAQIARNVDLASAAERRSWVDQLLGRPPAGLAGPLTAAQERAGAHVERHSLWLQNSIRGAIALAVAVFIADATGAQHAFWVVFGTLAVLRSNALATGQNILRAVLGTCAGFAIGGALVALIGTNTTILWILLPFVVLFAGFAPAAISFAVGQAAFTLVLLILFNIIAPEGWRIGLVRIEDVLLGCGISLLVGLLFWPRGAASALNKALAEAYADSARHLAAAVRYGVDGEPGGSESILAAAASRRLDDTFRSYLAERGSKPLPLADVTSLVTGVVGLRLAGDAVLDLWMRDGGGQGDKAAARTELLAGSERVSGWYDAFAKALTGRGEVPAPLDADATADSRLIAAAGEGETAVRLIWTGDHLDAARRLQSTLAGPGREMA